MTRTCAALLGFAVAGCSTMYDPCFEPASLVRDLRVLAVRVDPPEALYDPVTLQTDPVTVRALLALPDPKVSDLLRVRARICAQAEKGRCPDTAPWSASSSGPQLEQPPLTLEVPPSVVRDTIDADPLRGYAGAPATIELQATSADGRTVSASKVLLLSKAIPGYEPNHALEVPDMILRHKDGAEESVAGTPLVHLEVGETVGLTPRVAPGPGAAEAAEDYVVTDLAGNTARLRERISYSFYVTPHAQYGLIGRPEEGADVADEPPTGEPAPARGLVLLSSLYESLGRAFVVARDGRGGEAWLAFDFEAIDHRVCDRGGLVTKCADLEIGCK